MTDDIKSDSFDSPQFSDTTSTGTIFTNNQTVQRLIWAFVIIAGLYGLYQAISLTWVGDDAFISFRYAKNLIDGHGLVFNIGERVEGYTNFLWTIMIAGAMLIGLEPILFTQVVGLVSYIFIFLVLIFLSVKLSGQSKTKTFLFPVAAIAVLLQYDSQVWATSGLETAWVTFLITTAFALLIIADSKKTFLLAGIVFLMAVLSRPDAMIFYLMALPYIFLHSKKPGSNLVYYLVPLVIIYLPYWIIRFSYYGYPFPNTYYAKSAYLSWYSQGFIYLWTYIKTYYILILLPPAIVFMVPRLISRLRAEKSFSGIKHRIWLLSILFILPYIFYVVRVGGDFMFARFFIPITPICFLILETVLFSLNIKTFLKLGIGVVVILSVLFRWNQFTGEDPFISGIINERSFYPDEKIVQAKIDGHNLKKYLGGLDVTLGFFGMKAMVIYYSELPKAIECHAGLTDEIIAHQSLEERGRVGHEKVASEQYMRERKINFMVMEILVPADLAEPLTPDRLGIITFDGTMLPIKYYINDLMDTLKNIPEVKFVDFQKHLDNYIANIQDVPTDLLIKDFDQFQYYYFDSNNDTLRYNIFDESIKKRMNQSSEILNR